MSGNAQPNQRQALLQAVAQQQAQIRRLAHENQILALQMGYVAQLAGVDKQVEAIRKKADADNPAQPVPNPPSENAAESTEQAVTPEAYDDVRNPGMTPGSVNELPADTTDVALAPGESLPTAPFNELENVQAPVAGTETQLPLDQTRIEQDVRVGPQASPVVNPQVAFPWHISPNQSNQGEGGQPGQMTAAKQGGNRTIAALKLARLQIEAGMAETTDDLALGAQIESSQASDAEIASTTATLEQVRKAASRQARPANLVPRSASVQRTVPSLAGGSGSGMSTTAGAAPVADDTADSDLFD